MASNAPSKAAGGVLRRGIDWGTFGVQFGDEEVQAEGFEGVYGVLGAGWTGGRLHHLQHNRGEKEAAGR